MPSFALASGSLPQLPQSGRLLVNGLALAMAWCVDVTSSGRTQIDVMFAAFLVLGVMAILLYFSVDWHSAAC